MRVIFAFLMLACWFTSATAGGLPIKPKTLPVTLDTFTQITVPIVPDLGTRLVFPFVLDEKSEYVPFTIESTNAAFTVPKPQPGRNLVVITLPAANSPDLGAPLLGSVYITAGGYQVTVLLRSTLDVREYVSDVSFKLSDKARQDLIHQAVERKTESIRLEFEKKAAALDQQAHDLALQNLGRLLLTEPERVNIYEDANRQWSDGELEFSIPNAVELPGFRAYMLELTYESATNKSLHVTDSRLFGIDKDGRSAPIKSSVTLPPALKPGDTSKAVLVTDAADLGQYVGFEVIVNTERGEVSVKW